MSLGPSTMGPTSREDFPQKEQLVTLRPRNPPPPPPLPPPVPPGPVGGVVPPVPLPPLAWLAMIYFRLSGLIRQGLERPLHQQVRRCKKAALDISKAS